MATATELVASLIWGNTRKSLQKFLKENTTPQIVRIEDDFYGGDERARLHEGSIMMLHKVVTDKVLIGTESSDSQINIALSCSTPVYVRPLKCKFESCKVEDFKSIFPKVKYVKVKGFGSGSSTDDVQCAVNVDDLLQIIKIDKKKKNVICQDIDSKEDKILPYKCSVIFTPLQDYRTYALSEVVAKQGLPARVCFKGTRSQAANDRWDGALKGVTDVVFHKEVTEHRVIATVVGGVGEQACCLGLPADLPIQCSIAERLTKDMRNYEEVVRALNQGFDFRNFAEEVNIFQDLRNIKIYVPIISPEIPSPTRYANSPRRPRRNGVKSPPISPKPVRKITKTDPNESLNDPKCALAVPRPSYGAPDDRLAAKAAVHDGHSRSLHEDDANLDEENYVKMGSEMQGYYENTHREKISGVQVNDSGEKSKGYIEKTTKKSPLVFPKPIAKIKVPEPNGSSKDTKCPPVVPKPTYSPPADYCEATAQTEYDETSRSLHEESVATDEDGYVEMGIARHCYYENSGCEKNSVGEHSNPASQRNKNNDYEEVSLQPRWTAKQNQEFADPRFLLMDKRDDAKQTRPISAEYVIPLNSVLPHSRNSSPDCYENMYVTWNREEQTDREVYQNVVHQSDWESYSKECEITPSSESSEYVEMTGQTVRLEIA